MLTRALLLAMLVFAGGAIAVPGSASALAPCAKYASPTGSDSTSTTGSEGDPYLTANTLAQRLNPGETGCLVGPNEFDEPVVALNKPDLTLRSAVPTTRARITGEVRVNAGAPRAVLMALTINGSDLTSTPVVTVAGADARIVGNEIYSNDELACVYSDLNVAPYGARLRIEGNRIHDCDTGIALQRPANAVVVGNTIYGMDLGGVELFPNTDGAQVEHNTIVDNLRRGVLFGGSTGSTSDSNTVLANVITDSGPSGTDASNGNVGRAWDGAPGTGNRVVTNCLDDTGGNIHTPTVGFTVEGTKLVGDPGYTNALGRNYTLRQGSACMGYGVLPGVATGPVTAVSSSQATFNGTVNPHFQPADWFFEYGVGGVLNNQTPRTAAGSGSVPVDVKADVPLAAGTGYRYRLVAVNPSQATAPGDPVDFQTAPPVPTPTPTSTPTPTPTPDPDPDDDGLTGSKDKCEGLPAGRYDTNRNGCPGPMPLVKASYDVVSSQRRPGRKRGIATVKVLSVDMRVERGARVSVGCRGKGSCRKLKGTVRAKRAGVVKFHKGLPRDVAPKSVLVVRVQKRGKAGRFFLLRLRFRSVGWRQSSTGCIPIGSSRLKPMKACLDQRP